MQKHSVSTELIEGLIHLDNGKSTVIELPGKNASGRERVHTCYLMAGLASLLGSGDPSFSDEGARALCVHFGCYDKGNHSTFVKALGNQVTGSKASGWKLTSPGLSAIAVLIKAGNAGD